MGNSSFWMAGLPRLHFNASISVAWEEEVVVSVGFPFVLYWGGHL